MTNMLPDSLDSRDVLRRLASDILERLRNGGGPTKVESEHVDVKEEAGRRDRSGGLLVGTPQNPAAAEQLAGEVRCFSNTPGGGVIVVGVEDRTWRPLGTELDEEWLRQRINDLTGCAPYIDVTDVNGHRVLVVYVAESPDPVEDLDRRIRWRIGDQCRPVDRGEWWAHRAQRIGVDVMAASTKRTLAEVGGPAIDVVRRYLRAGGADQEVVDAAADQMLTDRKSVV